jgi:hypothetical protein
LARIAAQKTNDRSQNYHPDPASAEGDPAAHPASIFNISALPLVSPAHRFSPKNFVLTSVVVS